MFVAGLLSWWYGEGWRQRFSRLSNKLASTIDYFSIDLLLKTFFSPFRQIAAGKVRGSLDAQMRAFFDRLISRMIGAFIRFIMIIVGTLTIIIHAVVGVVIIAAWAFIPLLPIISVLLFLSGWVPWNL